MYDENERERAIVEDRKVLSGMASTLLDRVVYLQRPVVDHFRTEDVQDRHEAPPLQTSERHAVTVTRYRHGRARKTGPLALSPSQGEDKNEMPIVKDRDEIHRTYPLILFNGINMYI